MGYGLWVMSYGLFLFMFMADVELLHPLDVRLRPNGLR